jgi:chitin synthase
MGEDEDVHINDYDSFDSSDITSQDKEKGYAGDPVYSSHADYLRARYGMDIPKIEHEQPQDTQHYGPAPIGRVHRRNKMKKRVQLTRGNLVLDINVPTKLVLPLMGGEDEMLKTRYTAVTCDPDDFERSNFFLRQNEYGRRTEMFIVITMYNVSGLVASLRLGSLMQRMIAGG